MAENKKVVVVTGASSGLGLAVARHLSEAGHIVYAGARSFGNQPVDKNSAMKKMFLDVTDHESVESLVSHVIETEGKIDALINCAAILVLGSVEDTGIEEYEKVLNTNLGGTIRMCRSVLPHMRNRRDGLIINFSSIMGLMAIPFQSAYVSSKFAIEGFSEALSMEVKNWGIKVVILEPTDHKSGSKTYRAHAEKAGSSDSPYRDLFLKVTSVIEYDEAHGSEPESLAGFVGKIVGKNRPRLRYKVGSFIQKLAVLVKRLLPGRAFESIIYSYYKDRK